MPFQKLNGTSTQGHSVTSTVEIAVLEDLKQRREEKSNM